MDMDDFLFMCAVVDDIMYEESYGDLDWVEDFGDDATEGEDEDGTDETDLV